MQKGNLEMSNAAIEKRPHHSVVWSLENCCLLIKLFISKVQYTIFDWLLWKILGVQQGSKRICDFSSSITSRFSHSSVDPNLQEYSSNAGNCERYPEPHFSPPNFAEFPPTLSGNPTPALRTLHPFEPYDSSSMQASSPEIWQRKKYIHRIQLQ